MEQENKWNYVIAICCIVVIVLTTWFVLTNIQSPMTRTDTTGQANVVLLDVSPLSNTPGTGPEVTHPVSSAKETYAYLK